VNDRQHPFGAPGSYAAKLQEAIGHALEWIESADDRGSSDEKLAREINEARQILYDAHTMSEDLCPHCGKNLTYSYGEGMADSIFYCARSPEVEFSREDSGRFTGITLRPKTDARLVAMWMHDRYGDIPEKTLAIGSSFSPYDNPRFDWFEPDLSDFPALVQRIEQLARAVR